MTDKHKYIVFCEEHYNPLGIVRSLGENGISPILIVLTSKEKLVSKSRYIETVHYVATVEEGYELLLGTYGKESDASKPFVFTSDDVITSFLDHHYNELVSKCFFFNAGAPDRISFYMNKHNINQIATQYGLDVLPEMVANKGDIPAEIEYPVMTKSIVSTMGGWGKDVFICYSDEELKKHMSQSKVRRFCFNGILRRKMNCVLMGLVHSMEKM